MNLQMMRRTIEAVAMNIISKWESEIPLNNVIQGCMYWSECID
jgi:hypothetical protein